MTDEIKLNADISRASRAEALMRDELLQEAFASLEKRYLDEWRVTQFRDTDARERLWQAVNLVGKVKDHLAGMITNGKLAQRELDEIANRTERRFGTTWRRPGNTDQNVR